MKHGNLICPAKDTCSLRCCPHMKLHSAKNVFGCKAKSLTCDKDGCPFRHTGSIGPVICKPQ